MVTRTLITSEEFATIPTESACELVRGEIVPMSPAGSWHGVVCRNVVVLLTTWARLHRAGYVAANDSGVITERDPDTVRAPDCWYISTARLPAGVRLKGFLEVPPDLAIEIMSPSDNWSEAIHKAGEYLAAGVREVWIVEPQEQFVEVFRTDASPLRFDLGSELTSPAVLPGFRCQVSELFEEM